MSLSKSNMTSANSTINHTKVRNSPRPENFLKSKLPYQDYS